MTATVTPLRWQAGDLPAPAAAALERAHRYLDQCKLAERTVTAYRRQTRAYVA